MRSIPTRGRRPLSHRPHRFSRASVYATDCGLTPLARYSSIYVSTNRSHLLIAVLPNVGEGEHHLPPPHHKKTNKTICPPIELPWRPRRAPNCRPRPLVAAAYPGTHDKSGEMLCEVAHLFI